MKSMKETVEEALATLLHGIATQPMAGNMRAVNQVSTMFHQATIETQKPQLRHTAEADLPQTSLHQQPGIHAD
jgi:hypothetical protein